MIDKKEHWYKLMQYIIQHDPSAIVVLDKDLNHIFVSDRFIKDYNVGEKDIIGRNHYEVFPEIPEKWRQVHRRALAGEVVKSSEEDCFVREDGSVDYTRWQCRPWYQSDDSVGGIILYTEVITRNKQLEEELQKTKQEKDVILENIAEIVTYQDNHHSILWANRTAEKVTGINVKDLVGQKCYAVFYRRREPCDNCPVEEVFETGQVVSREMEPIKGNYTRLTGSPVRDNQGNVVGVVTTSLDITENILAKKALNNFNQELEQRVEERTAELASTNKELDAFTYSVSHDLREPLRTISGFSEILLEDYHEDLDDTGKDYLKRVCDASQLMGDLIDDLLRLSRISRQEIVNQEVDLSSIVTSCLTRLQERDSHRQVEAQIVAGIVDKGDASLIKIALENMLTNAWKYTSKKSRALIEFGITEEDGKKVYYIKDNGEGFDMKHKKKLFQAFGRLHSTEEYQGIGIGLTIVRRIINRHGGQVWALGAVGEGATFFFTFGD